MEEASKIATQVKSIESKNFRVLHQRMDDDYARWQLKGTQTRGSLEYLASTKTRNTDIKIVSNAPRTFCDNVQSIFHLRKDRLLSEWHRLKRGKT